MPTNRTQQERILAAAQADGSLASIYWYPIATNKPGEPAVAVCGAVPAIRAAPDWQESRHYAHLLISLLDCPGVTFGLEITTADLLAECGLPWFVWGEHDHVCPGCGAIGNDCICVAVRTVDTMERLC